MLSCLPTVLKNRPLKCVPGADFKKYHFPNRRKQKQVVAPFNYKTAKFNQFTTGVVKVAFPLTYTYIGGAFVKGTPNARNI
jgi:hypothetical protein